MLCYRYVLIPCEKTLQQLLKRLHRLSWIMRNHKTKSLLGTSKPAVGYRALPDLQRTAAALAPRSHPGRLPAPFRGVGLGRVGAPLPSAPSPSPSPSPSSSCRLLQPRCLSAAMLPPCPRGALPGASLLFLLLLLPLLCAAPGE